VVSLKKGVVGWSLWRWEEVHCVSVVRKTSLVKVYAARSGVWQVSGALDTELL
jgi:hypothetical protein